MNTSELNVISSIREMLINHLSTIPDIPQEPIIYAVQNKTSIPEIFCSQCVGNLHRIRGPRYIPWGMFCIICNKLLGFQTPTARDIQYQTQFAMGRCRELVIRNLKLNSNTKPLITQILSEDVRLNKNKLKQLVEIFDINIPIELFL